MRIGSIGVLLFSLLSSVVLADDMAVFPPPLSGWEAGEVKTAESRESLLGMLVVRRQLVREYFAPGGGGLGIMIDTFDCEAAAIIHALHSDEEFRSKAETEQGMRPSGVSGREAMELHDEMGGRVMVAVRLSDCMVVSLGGEEPPPSGAFEAYLKRLDFEQIEQLASEN